MRYTVRAFLATAGLLAALTLAYVVIEFARGHVPFAMLQWEVGGKFVTFAFLGILFMGTMIGVQSDRMQARKRR